jgi:hypothetical protein
VAGIGTDSADSWSRFTRVWERQQRGDFRWVYTVSAPDADLTQARRERERKRTEDEALAGDVIEVEAGNFIRAKVADCSTPPAGDPPLNGAEAVSGLSKDRTLRWGWEARPGSFVAYSWNGTGWDEILPDTAAVGE